jgi:GTP-binding protein Era
MTKAKKPAPKQTTKPKPKAKPKVVVKTPAKPAPKPLPKAKPENTRAGFVAILGATNAGKSTLLNRLVGQKVSIVSPKVQTTRMRVLGVLTEGDTQIGFIDTPGIFAAKRRLDHAMVHAAWNSLQDADAVVLLVDANGRLDDQITSIIEELKRRNKRIVLALNKIDKLNPTKLLPIASQLNATGIVDDIFMISALNGDGVFDLKKHLTAKMPPSPWFFDEDQLSDLPSQVLAAEITREQLYRQLQQELPYAATVVPENWEAKKDGSVIIRQSIVVARANHRPIVLGNGGARIKSIGQGARQELEKVLGHKVHLFLEVKVDEKWQDRPEFYRMFGLEFKPN